MAKPKNNPKRAEAQNAETQAADTKGIEATVHRLERASTDESTAGGRADTTADSKTGEMPAMENRTRPASVSDPSALPRGRRTRAGKQALRRRILFAALPIVLVIACYFYVTGGAIMSTDNAYVQADTVGLSTDVAGIVKEIQVRDNQQVEKGQVLFRLDDLPFRLALERAEAQLGNTRNDLLALQANYRNMQTQVDQAQTDVDFNTTNFKRQQQLIANNFTPQATFDAARNTLQASQQRLASLQQQLAGLAANLNGNPNAPIENHPRYRDALAARDESKRQLDHTVVRAPYAGIVTNVPSLQVGQYLAAAATAFNIVSTDHVWVQANPKETELTWVRSGQKVTIEVDSYPGIEWTGAVESISPASASSFSLLPAENTSGNWVKVVQRIPMRVRVDLQPGQPPLRVGMSVEVSVNTGHARGFPNLLTSWFRSPHQA